MSLEHRRQARLCGRVKWIILGIVLVAGLSIVTVGIVGVLWFARDRGLIPISFDRKAAATVCSQVVSGILKPDVHGVVKLPPASAGLSISGEIYVTTDASGTVWVLFRTWVGKGCNLHGYLYRSTPATGPVPATIKVLGPVLRREITDPPTDQIDYDVHQQIGPNWYEVSFSLG
ncbi:MAG: hypothetical protein ABSH20_27015 [Tepidisphaeraceae bacterium]